MADQKPVISPEQVDAAETPPASTPSGSPPAVVATTVTPITPSPIVVTAVTPINPAAIIATTVTPITTNIPASPVVATPSADTNVTNMASFPTSPFPQGVQVLHQSIQTMQNPMQNPSYLQHFNMYNQQIMLQAMQQAGQLQFQGLPTHVNRPPSGPKSPAAPNSPAAAVMQGSPLKVPTPTSSGPQPPQSPSAQQVRPLLSTRVSTPVMAPNQGQVHVSNPGLPRQNSQPPTPVMIVSGVMATPPTSTPTDTAALGKPQVGTVAPTTPGQSHPQLSQAQIVTNTGQILTSQPAVITNPAVLNQLQAMALQQSNLPIGHSPAIINQPVFIRAAGPIQAHPSVLASVQGIQPQTVQPKSPETPTAKHPTASNISKNLASVIPPRATRAPTINVNPMNLTSMAGRMPTPSTGVTLPNVGTPVTFMNSANANIMPPRSMTNSVSNTGIARRMPNATLARSLSNPATGNRNTGIAGRIPTVGRPRGRPPLHHSLSTRGRLQSKIGTGVRGGGNAGTRHSSPRGQNQIPLQKIASASASLSMPQLTPKPRVQYPPTLPPQTLHHTDVFDAHVQNNTTRTPDSDEPPTLTEEVPLPSTNTTKSTHMEGQVNGDLGGMPIVQGKQKAIVKPQVLTHIIEGFLIQEAAEPFPVQRSSLLTSMHDTSNRPVRAERDSEEEKRLRIQKGQNPLAPITLKCEFCGKCASATKFKRSKRFCSTSCAKRYNVGCSKRLGLFERKSQSQLLNQAAKQLKKKKLLRMKKSWRRSTGKMYNYGPPHIGDGNTESGDLSSSISGRDEDSSSTPPSTPHDYAMEVDQHKTQPSKWSVQEVFEFIKNVPGCLEYAAAFREQEIDGQALLLLKEDHLMSAMNMKLGPALKVCAKINQLKDEDS